MTDMPDRADAYPDELLARHSHSFARLERAMLAEELERVGPPAPTLCGDWDAHHLVTHLVVRESPWGAAAAPVHVVGDRIVDRVAARRGFAELVEAFRSGPPRLSFYALPGMDRRFNTLEFFVHHEDVRRAAPGWQPRALPGWAEDKLWRGLGVMARLSLRRSPVGVTLERADTGEQHDARPGEPHLVLHGLPSELLLYAFGRDEVADVHINGPQDAVRAFRATSFSI
jgi:uncharacterized protein (TIGR03085 family)